MSYKVFAVIISAAMLCTMLAGCKDKAGDNPLITKDQLAELKQSIVDEYNFLTGNGFMVSTVDSNVAEQLIAANKPQAESEASAD